MYSILLTSNCISVYINLCFPVFLHDNTDQWILTWLGNFNCKSFKIRLEEINVLKGIFTTMPDVILSYHTWCCIYSPHLYVFISIQNLIILHNVKLYVVALTSMPSWFYAYMCVVFYLWTTSHKNIERHTAHTTVSWPNPKQWLIFHTSDLMMIIRTRDLSVYQASWIVRLWSLRFSHKGNWA